MQFCIHWKRRIFIDLDGILEEEQHMSIFVCGDIHSTLDIDKLDRFKKRRDLTKNDYLIICGDTGICGPNKKNAIATREYLRNLPMTVLFADGNPAGAKAQLSNMGYIKNILRLPLVPAREDVREALKEAGEKMQAAIRE